MGLLYIKHRHNPSECSALGAHGQQWRTIAEHVLLVQDNTERGLGLSHEAHSSTQ